MKKTTLITESRGQELSYGMGYPFVVPQKFDGLEAGYNPQYGLHPGSSLQIAFPREEVNIYPAN